MGIDRIVGPINWDVDGEDWECWQKGMTPESCADRYYRLLTGRARQNGIFLMHDRPEFNVGHEGPLSMTRLLVPRLKAAGFRFASIDEVLSPGPRDGGSGCPHDAGRANPGDTGSGGDAMAVDTTRADATAGEGGAVTPLDMARETSGGTGGPGDTAAGGSGGAAGAADSGTGSGGEPGGAGGSGPPRPAKGGCQCGVGAPRGEVADEPAALALLLVALITRRRCRGCTGR
jgi:MYXO-CTERM domain-containing protein